MLSKTTLNKGRGEIGQSFDGGFSFFQDGRKKIDIFEFLSGVEGIIKWGMQKSSCTSHWKVPPTCTQGMQGISGKFKDFRLSLLPQDEEFLTVLDQCSI